MSLSEIMSGSGLHNYAEVALILFLVAFVIILVRTFWPGRDAEMEAASRLPLDDEHVQNPRTGAQR